MIGEAPKALQAQPVTASEAFVRGGRGRLRTLVVCAAPLGPGMPLDLRREWTLLCRHAEESRVPVTLFRLLPPTPDAFRRALRQCADREVTPHIVHFAGHGQPRYLCFEDELGREARFQREGLAEVLGEHRIPVVTLNACHTATKQTVSLAKYLVDQGAIEVAVGHREPVADSSAVAFSGELYRQLCNGEEAYLAFVRARSLLSQIDPGAATSIELFGNDSLQLTPQAQVKDPGTRVFDGTYGRGRMPEVPAFFGREEEMVRLARVLADESKRGAALVGVGGIGKTTLALELANRHAWRYPGGMAFASVRSILFGEPSADELARRAASALMVPATVSSDPVERLLRYLEQQPGLLVFDNLEDLPAQELGYLLGVIEQMPLNGSKVLLTLRPSPQLLHERSCLQVVTLTSGLADQAGAAYVVRQGREKEIPALQVTPDQQGEYQGLPLHLTQALAGHPMMLDVAVGIASRGLAELHRAVPELDGAESAGKVAKTIAATAMEERIDTLYASSVSLLDDHGRWLLGLLPAFPDGSFTPDELRAATLAARAEATEAILDELQRGLDSCLRAGLIDRQENDVFRCHSTAQEYARQHLAFDPEVYRRTLLALLAASLSFVNKVGRDYSALEQRLGHILGLCETAWQLADDNQLVREAIAATIEKIGIFLLHRGFWPVLDRWQQRIGDRAPDDAGSLAQRQYQHSVLLLNQGHAEQARQALSEPLRFFEQSGNRQGLATCRYQLARIEHFLAGFDEAEQLANEALQLYEEIGDQQGCANCLHELAIIESDRGMLREARGYLEDSLRIKEAIDDHRGRAASLHQLAIIESAQGNHAEARDLLSTSIQITSEMGDQQGLAASLHQLALAAQCQGDYVEAVERLKQSAQLFDSIEDLPGRAASLHQLAVVETCLGKLDAAVSHLEQASEIFAHTHDQQGRAAVLHQLAAVRQEQGSYAEARALLEESIQIDRAIGDQQNLSASLYALAIIEYREGDYDGARRLLDESIPIDEAAGNHQGRAASLHQLAIIESCQGNFEEARGLLGEAIRLNTETGDRQVLAASLHQLGVIESATANPDRARKRFAESISIKEEIGDTRGYAASLHQLAKLELGERRLDRAGHLLAEVSAIDEEIGDIQGQAVTLHDLAVLEYLRGEPNQACTLVRESLQLSTKIGDAHGRALSLLLLGQLEASMGEHQPGTLHVREAVDILRELGSADLADAEDTLSELLEQEAGGLS